MFIYIKYLIYITIYIYKNPVFYCFIFIYIYLQPSVQGYGLDIPLWPKTVFHPMNPREAKKLNPSGIFLSFFPIAQQAHESPPQEPSPVLFFPLKMVGDGSSHCHVYILNLPTLVYICTNTYRRMSSCMLSHSDLLSDSLKSTFGFGGALLYAYPQS